MERHVQNALNFMRKDIAKGNKAYLHTTNSAVEIIIPPEKFAIIERAMGWAKPKLIDAFKYHSQFDDDFNDDTYDACMFLYYEKDDDFQYNCDLLQRWIIENVDLIDFDKRIVDFDALISKKLDKLNAIEGYREDLDVYDWIRELNLAVGGHLGESLVKKIYDVFVGE